MSKTRKSSRLAKSPGTRKMKPSQLYESYGSMILKKGTVLYHTNAIPFSYRSDKPMLFLSIHPSEWHNSNESYVASVQLKRDVKLLFMIQEIRNVRIFSSLNLFAGNNLAKTQNNALYTFANKLQAEHFDGWFTSIENGSSVEVALINDPSIYSVIECKPLKIDWKNTNYINDCLVPKQWGNTYSISSKHLPIELDLHERFRGKIERYIETLERNEPFGTAFSILLDNAKIKYHSGKIYDIHW